jgi:hypothetical protein
VLTRIQYEWRPTGIVPRVTASAQNNNVPAHDPC